MPFVKQITYFAEKPEIKEIDYLFLCEHFRYEVYQPGRNIICIGNLEKRKLCLGDYGDKFYVILDGLVSVLVP